MDIKGKIIAASLILVLVAGGFVGALYFIDNRVDMTTIDYIKKMQRGPNDFSDPGNDIAVTSSADIGFIVEGDYKISIHYGKQIINMTKKCFESQEYRDALSKIGIKVYTRVDDSSNVQYKVTYWGETVDEYSRIN